MLISLVSTLIAGAGLLQAAPLTRVEAEVVVGLARAAAGEDGGRLWGRSLDGPLLIVERRSGLVYASEAPDDSSFVVDGSLYRGRLPDQINPANTAIDWAGRRWTMVLWPLPTDPTRRRQLLAHELWHRIQDSLDLPLHSPSNPHLDAGPGRVWLRLEARALAVALGSAGSDRRAALADALRFRLARVGTDRLADSMEAALERNEGLAEYTGHRLSGASGAEQRRRAIASLGALDSAASFARSFAYVTGPGYGLLLDELRPDWRREIGEGSSLPGLARRALGGSLPAAATDSARYGVAEVRRQENRREQLRVARLAQLRVQFVEGPRLELPLGQAEIGFDPGRVETLPDVGTVYGGLRLSDAWGVLDATAGAGLVAMDWKKAVVPIGPEFSVTDPAGPGWRLSLQPGWTVVQEGRTDLWRVRKTP